MTFGVITEEESRNFKKMILVVGGEFQGSNLISLSYPRGLVEHF